MAENVVAQADRAFVEEDFDEAARLYTEVRPVLAALLPRPRHRPRPGCQLPSLLPRRR